MGRRFVVSAYLYEIKAQGLVCLPGCLKRTPDAQQGPSEPTETEQNAEDAPLESDISLYETRFLDRELNAGRPLVRNLVWRLATCILAVLRQAHAMLRALNSLNAYIQAKPSAKRLGSKV